jgi:hypothetical protein
MMRVRHLWGFLVTRRATQSKLGNQLREKDCLDSLSFSPMLVNCCARSRNSTHIGRRSLPSASQQLDESQMVKQEHTKTARTAASGGNFDE